MKFIYSILALASVITVNAQNGCVFNTCVKEGERCDLKYFNYTNADSAVITCEYGTFCPDTTGSPNSGYIETPVCTRLLGYGETCNSANPFTLCASPYDCISRNTPNGAISTCNILSYLGYGEDCNTDQQCVGNLKCVNEQCGRLPEVNCANDLECPSGQYCDTTKTTDGYNPNACTPWMATDAVCTRDTQCAYDHYCDLTSATATCKPNFNKASGSTCGVHNPSEVNYNVFQSTRYECNAGLYCPSNGGVCTTAPSKQSGSCTTNSATPANCYINPTFGSVCQCESTSNVESGSCTDFTTEFNGDCQNSISAVAQCAIKNGCPALSLSSLGNFGPESCIFKNCGDLMCDNKCDVSPASSLQCGDVVVNPICNIPSSSSIVLPSFVILIVALIALLF